MKRIKASIEPRLNIHRYVMAVYFKGRVRYFYLVNRVEIRAKRKEQKNFDMIEIYKADHNYIEGWVKL